MANRWGNNGNSETLLLGAPKSLQMVTAAMKLKDTSGQKNDICLMVDTLVAWEENPNVFIKDHLERC